MPWQEITRQIAATTGRSFQPKGLPDLTGGGCINQTYRLGDGRDQYFVKINRADLLWMFQAEAAGLQALAQQSSLRVPQPLCQGLAGGHAYLVLEYISLSGGGRGGMGRAGEGLAQLHQRHAADFGWSLDNSIGATPQPNAWEADWVRFWREHRLGFQLQLAARHGYGGRLQQRGERLLADFPALIDHNPVPALLHGDLWGGNLGFDSQGTPVIYDPAVYYGDREADVAMTELFGGFSADFYAAYRQTCPLAPGYPVRRDLYNLYHILNHLNLFGGGYLGQAQGLMDRLLSELA